MPGRHRLTGQHRIQRRPQIRPVTGNVVAGPGTVQLPPIDQLVVGVEEKEIRRAGRMEGLRYRLIPVMEVGQRHAEALLLGRHVPGTVLRVGLQAVAADAHKAYPLPVIALQAGQFRLHVLDEGAVDRQKHHQHRPGGEFTAGKHLAVLYPRQPPGRHGRSQGKHGGFRARHKTRGIGGTWGSVMADATPAGFMPIPAEARFQKLLPLLARHWGALLAGAGCILVNVGTFPLLAQVAGNLLPAVGGGRFQEALAIITVAMVVFLVQKLAQYGKDTLLAGPSLRVSQALRQAIFARLQRLSFPALEKLSSGDLAYRLTEDADRVGETIYKTIHDSTPSALQLVAVLGYMAWLDGPLTAATLLLAPVVILLVGWFGRQVLRASERSQAQVSNLAAMLAEAIGGMHLVRAFASEAWLQQRFARQIDEHRRARFRTLEMVALQHPVVGFLEAAGVLAILLLGAWRIHTGSLSVEQFSSYGVALLMLVDPISHLTNNFNEFQQGRASLRRLRLLEQEPLEPPDPPRPLSLGKVQGELLLENVHFSHTPTQPLFRNLNLRVQPGRLVALVGASGAGKSTLFSLLLRFNTPQRGRILLDGKDLCRLRAAELRRQLALVPQDALLFSGTIAETIDFGRGHGSTAIRRAAQLANAEGFILAMGGYDVRIGERAANLSGGQRQRLAIARAVVGDPALLLLDEATSALDAETETAVQQGLRRAMVGRTVLVIAHRLATVQGADQILVLERGAIVEQGTHQQLLSQAGRYEELCRQQLIHTP